MTNITTPTFPAVVFSVTDAGIAELEAKHKGLVAAPDTKPVQENARLIAACPDLLAVAEEVINNQEALPAYLVAMAIHAVGRATI